MSNEFKMADDSKPLIPEGTYSIQYLRHEKRKYHGDDKLYVYFQVVTQGPVFGTQLFKIYNYYSSPPAGSQLFKDLHRLSGKRVKKNSRFSMELFQKDILLALIRTVKKDSNQVPLPEYMQYSVIGLILGRETGGTL